jgi:hypothetical protein
MERCDIAQKPRDRQSGRKRSNEGRLGITKGVKVKQRPGGEGVMGRMEREECRGMYFMSVTAAVFHPDKFPLNDAPTNMDLHAGRQACAGDAARQLMPGGPR